MLRAFIYTAIYSATGGDERLRAEVQAQLDQTTTLVENSHLLPKTCALMDQIIERYGLFQDPADDTHLIFLADKKE